MFHLCVNEAIIHVVFFSMRINNGKQAGYENIFSHGT